MEEQSNESRQTWVAGDDVTAGLVKLLESHPPVLSRTVADNIPTCLALSLAARVYSFS